MFEDLGVWRSLLWTSACSHSWASDTDDKFLSCFLQLASSLAGCSLNLIIILYFNLKICDRSGFTVVAFPGVLQALLLSLCLSLQYWGLSPGRKYCYCIMGYYLWLKIIASKYFVSFYFFS